MVQRKRTLTALTLFLTLAIPSVVSATTSLPDGSFQVANMAPPEPEPNPTIPPDAVPPVSPDQLPATDAPPAPEVPSPPPETLPAELPPATSSGGGMGMGVIIAIVAAIATALIAGTWVARRK